MRLIFSYILRGSLIHKSKLGFTFRRHQLTKPPNMLNSYVLVAHQYTIHTKISGTVICNSTRYKKSQNRRDLSDYSHQRIIISEDPETKPPSDNAAIADTESL